MHNDTTNLSRKEREEAFRKNIVLDAAEHLFAQKGFEKTTVSDIAAEAELAKGSLYQIFKSKEKIFIALVDRKMTGIFSELDYILKLEIGPGEKIRLLIRKKLQAFREHRDFARIFINECKGFHMHMPDSLAHGRSCFVNEYMDRIYDIIRDGQKSGELRTDVSADILLAALGGLTNGVMFKWLEMPDKIDIDMAVEKMEEIFMSGAGVKIP